MHIPKNFKAAEKACIQHSSVSLPCDEKAGLGSLPSDVLAAIVGHLPEAKDYARLMATGQVLKKALQQPESVGPWLQKHGVAASSVAALNASERLQMLNERGLLELLERRLATLRARARLDSLALMSLQLGLSREAASMPAGRSQKAA